MEENEKKNEIEERKELLKQVEKAAHKGTVKAKFTSGFLQVGIILAAIVLLAVFVMSKIDSVNKKMETLFAFDSKVGEHDLVLENNGIFGYTAADFQDAILGDSRQLRKIEVFTQEISEATTITQAGFLNWSAFSKNQIITFTGTAVYTVDLSSLKQTDILYDQDQRIITLYIPHAQQEEINMPESNIKFGDTEKGLLAFGDIKLTAQQHADVMSGARAKIQEKLDQDRVIDQADRFARLTVWELYSPIVKGVARDCSLEVEFRS